jgi:hypothetical protein
MKILMSAAIAAMLLAMAACAAEEDTNDAIAVDAVEHDQMPMEGMPGMAGMAGMQDDGMMRQMQARMATMMAMNPDSMMAMMPMHRQMAANMLAQMNREMREMDMAGDEAWTATVDSLRQDLTRMPEMSPDEMAATMPGHQARMNRLMEMHRSMMGSGEM